MDGAERVSQITLLAVILLNLPMPFESPAINRSAIAQMLQWMDDVQALQVVKSALEV